MVTQGYARMYRANSIITATPGQLVLMLYDGALKAMDLALDAFEQPADDRGRIALINRHLLKAQMIISELQGNLNLQDGGDFAATMHQLYDYHNRRLLQANVRKDPEIIREVERLLREIRDAWAQMLAQSEVNSPEEGLRGVA